MQDRQTKTMEVVNPFGEKRKYTFKLLTALRGTYIFHRYVSIILDQVEQIREFIDIKKVDNEEKPGYDIKINPIELARHIPRLFSFENICELAEDLLAGTIVEIDGDIVTIGDSGIGEYTVGDPLELYVSLYYALRANFPKLLDPILEDPEKKEEENSGSQVLDLLPEQPAVQVE